MRGAYRDPGQRCAKEGDGTGRLRAESADGIQLRDARAHGVDDAPSTEIRSQRDRRVRGEDDRPVIGAPGAAEVCFAHVSGGVERTGNDAHGLLRVVAAVSETVGG